MRILKNEYDKWISIIEVKIYAEKIIGNCETRDARSQT
jgi:hypothetical protein